MFSLLVVLLFVDVFVFVAGSTHRNAHSLLLSLTPQHFHANITILMILPMSLLSAHTNARAYYMEVCEEVEMFRNGKE
jgi:hypothetical protein